MTDVDGVTIGQIEELRAEILDGETVVTEIHLGPAALWERLGGFALQLPFARMIPIARREYRLPWSAVGLADPDHPRVLDKRSSLRRMRRED